MEVKVIETKKQNQILKLAISRLNIEFKKLKEKAGDTFVTQSENIETSDKKDLSIDEIFDILTRYLYP